MHVFDYHSLSSPDFILCAKIFNSFKDPFVIACDNFADHVSSITELYRQIHRDDFLVIGFERSYRMPYVIQAMAGIPFEKFNFATFEPAEAKQLIAKMHQYGLTSAAYDPNRIDAFASDLTTDSIAVAVCRIMNDFRPIEKIVESILDDADDDRKKRYVACALASYCYKPGLGFPVLSAALPTSGLREQFLMRDILPVSFFDHSTKDYVVPANPVLGQRVLRRVADYDELLMSEIYGAIGAYIAPYVNRNTIIKRTPEARLAGRLFDYDEVVSQFLPTQSEKFFCK
jgi:hypothetical protein